jgi:hypothetical protein
MPDGFLTGVVNREIFDQTIACKLSLIFISLYSRSLGAILTFTQFPSLFVGRIFSLKFFLDDSEIRLCYPQKCCLCVDFGRLLPYGNPVKPHRLPRFLLRRPMRLLLVSMVIYR